ncbi:MAG: murein biosynthesis integral membrane protein MurJ [Clostridiales bacterium]|nr:murein biosynthesis integral membrane protein MurJ [Clostridiales bacterium]
MKKGNLIKSTGIVMIIALISKFIGAIRDILISSNFGVSEYTDAYKLSASIPDTIFMIVGLAISTSFLPMLSKIKANEGKKEMYKFANNVINILVIISFIIFIIASFFPREIVQLLTNDAKPMTIELASDLTRIILINLLFLAVNACFTALLQVNEDFIIPSILGLFFNLPMIIYILLAKDLNVYGLTIANVVGNLFRVIVQIPSLHKNGYKYKFIIDFKDERIKKILLLIVPVIIGAGANSINLIVDKKMASSIIGGITTLDNAQLLVSVVSTMITTAITSVIYPILSNRINEGKKEEFLEILSKTIVYMAILLIPITIGLIIYRVDVIKIVYLRGEFTENNISMTSLALLGYTLGIFFVGVRDILNSTLFSMGKTKITAKNGVIGVIINIILTVILSEKYGILGISIASSIAMAITSILLFVSIVKLEGKINVYNIFTKIAKILFSSLIMGGGILLINILSNELNYIISLIIGTICGIIIYGIIMYVIKIDEFLEILSFTKRKG